MQNFQVKTLPDELKNFLKHKASVLLQEKEGKFHTGSFCHLLSVQSVKQMTH